MLGSVIEVTYVQRCSVHIIQGVHICLYQMLCDALTN